MEKEFGLECLPVIIHQDENAWWFYVETYADRAGPYGSYEEAAKELDRYCEEVLSL
jgi:hypothetical protein